MTYAVKLAAAAATCCMSLLPTTHANEEYLCAIGPDGEEDCQEVYFEPDIYDNPRVTDLPANVITFFDGKDSKTIRCRFEVPSDMLDLIKELRTLAEATEGCTAKQNL